MATLSIYKGTALDTTKVPIKDGQLLFETDTKKIWLDNGTTREQVGGDNIPFVVGTQTTTTGSWTGVASEISNLTDGQTIRYWLPYKGSGNATLNLTLANGTTTGAINCYYSGTTRLTTQYPAGNIILLTYRKNVSIAGSSTKYTGWWAQSDYDSNNYDRMRYQQAIKCGTTAIVAGNIIVGINGVYQHLKSGAAFDITYPILYANSAMAASATGNANYLVYPFTITTTQSLTLTAYKPVYIKGTLNGTTFTPVSTTPLTQTVPTTEDGYDYMLLGTAYSTTAMYLLPEHPIFRYRNNSFRVDIGSDGIWDLSARGTAIPQNADLDTYTTPGIYYSQESAYSKTMANTPTTGAGFTLIVEQGYIDTYYYQLAFSNGSFWYRNRSSTTWTEWYDVLRGAKLVEATTSKAGLMSAVDKTKLNATNIAYGTCTTAAATAAKVVTTAGNTNWKLTAGAMVSILFTYTNTASNPTLNVNNTGAKNIFYENTQITSSNKGYAGTANRIMTFMYDGTQYRFVSWAYDGNTNTYLRTYIDESSTYPILASRTAASAWDSTYESVYGTISSGITMTPSTGTITATKFDGTATAADSVPWTGVSGKTNATQSAAGLMSTTDKTKLNATNIAYGTCPTAAATAAKVITISGNTNWTLAAGSIIVVKFSYTNTASNPTFNVNETGAKSVWYNTAVLTTSSLSYAGYANRYGIYVYDGTQYVFLGWSYDANSTYSNASLGQGYGTCTTAEATTAKVVSLSSYALVTGGVVAVKFTNAVPANATMNINSKGAKAIYYKNAAIPANIIKAGNTATFIYDGTRYQLLSIDDLESENLTIDLTDSEAGIAPTTNSDQLGGIPANEYALKIDTAPDAAKLGGKLPSEYLTMDLLWENASPTSEFAEQSISLDLSEYVFVLIVNKALTSGTAYYSIIAPVGYITYQPTISSNVLVARTINVSASKITFGTGRYWSSLGSSYQESDTRAYPILIYGIKGTVD